MKNIRFFYLKIFIFWVVKFSVYLNRRVFVMKISSLLNDPKCENCFFEMDEIKFTLFLSNNGFGHYEQRYSFK